VSDNEIEDALYYSYAHSVTEGPDVPDWTPDEVWSQLFKFCGEVRAIENIISNALIAGDVAMLSRAAAQLKYTTVRQFGGISSVVTFTAGKRIYEGPTPGENEVANDKGKHENLFEALINLDLVQGDVDAGRTAARMTDMMQRWVADSHEHFMYLMGASLRDQGWTEEEVAEYSAESAVPDLDMGLMENLDTELLSLFDNSDDEDEEK
jgi:hypothetical protein